MERRATVPIDVRKICQLDLEERGVWQREHDPKQSTQFTYARFYIPYLANYKGWALFCDDDFLWLGEDSFSQDSRKISLHIKIF